ncbi:MAG: hypothetical protein H0U75_08065 [Legionella sp.]|nr:hypothetical protein [Legionella sp.]
MLRNIISEYYFDDKLFADFDTTTVSGRKKILKSYYYAIQYSYIKMLNINTIDDYNTFMAYRCFFRYINKYDDVVNRHECLAAIGKLKKEEMIFS